MSGRPSIPEPQPGWVIRYSYLWRNEARRGQSEGVKDRPCVVIITRRLEAGQIRVFVLPVTHTAPSKASEALEIPEATKGRLRLDAARSWVMVTEMNIFTWPGFDIRRLGDRPGYAYGILPRAMTMDLIEAVRRHQQTGHLGTTIRDEQ